MITTNARLSQLMSKWDDATTDAVRTAIARQLVEMGVPAVVEFCRLVVDGYDSDVACSEMESLQRAIERVKTGVICM